MSQHLTMKVSKLIGYLTICSGYNWLNNGRLISSYSTVAKATTRVATKIAEETIKRTRTIIIEALIKEVKK